MKKPVVRILLFVVLLGLAIFYFTYTREGFEDYAVVKLTEAVAAGTEAVKAAATATEVVRATPEPASSPVFAEGYSCPQNGKQAKTDKGKTLYCCSGTWKSTEC